MQATHKYRVTLQLAVSRGTQGVVKAEELPTPSGMLQGRYCIERHPTPSMRGHVTGYGSETLRGFSLLTDKRELVHLRCT